MYARYFCAAFGIGAYVAGRQCLFRAQAYHPAVEQMDSKAADYVRDRMPLIGLGTYEIHGRSVTAVLDAALTAGYRMIDTAQEYGNEEEIGEALQKLLPKHNLQREDVFLITKLWPSNHGKSRAGPSIEESLAKLKTEYVDLLLIHWPGAWGHYSSDGKVQTLRRESWQVMEEMHKAGKLRSIGVSNYEVRHLEELLSFATVRPAVNQCEYHPYYDQHELIAFCRDHGIAFQAYSSFGTPEYKDLLMGDPAIKAMAAKYECSVPNFLLAWSICQGISVLPRSRNPQHVTSNFEAMGISLSAEDIKSVAKSERRKFSWDPTRIA